MQKIQACLAPDTPNGASSKVLVEQGGRELRTNDEHRPWNFLPSSSGLKNMGLESEEKESKESHESKEVKKKKEQHIFQVFQADRWTPGISSHGKSWILGVALARVGGGRFTPSGLPLGTNQKELSNSGGFQLGINHQSFFFFAFSTVFFFFFLKPRHSPFDLSTAAKPASNSFYTVCLGQFGVRPKMGNSPDWQYWISAGLIHSIIFKPWKRIDDKQW